MRSHVLLFATLLISGVTPCLAEVSEYDIEIVIFEDLSSRYIDSEKWPRVEHALPLEENTPAFITETPLESVSAEYPEKNDVINIARSNNSMLDAHVKKLEASSRYHVLVHKSWRQTGLDAESAIDIEIDSTKNRQSRDAPASLQSINTNITDPAMNPGEELTSSVAGQVKITLGRYLHIYTDLIYKKPSPPNTPIPVSLEDSRYSEFLLKTHRRMRSKELHYLDHPLVGILVMALPVEKPGKNP